MFTKLLPKVLSMGLLVLALGVLATAPAYANDGPIVDQALPLAGQKIGWAAFQGAPTIVNGQTRVWVWNETVSGQNKLHIRTTTNGAAHTFSGTVTTGSAGNFYNLALYNAAGGDDSASLVGYSQFTFSIATTAGGEGVDVDWSGRWLSLDLFIDSARRPAWVLYGASATAAKKLPLVVNAGDNGLLTLALTMLDGPTGYQKNIANGYYIYRDTNGQYHLRLTTTKVGDIVDYKGTIIADSGQLGAITIYRGDPRDYYRLSGGKTLDFRFITNGGEDGLDWSLSGGGMSLTLKMNGQIAAPNVALGSNPFGTLQALTFRSIP